MHSRLGEHQPVGVVAGDGERRALDAGLVARLQVDDVALEAAPLDPAKIHAQQHLGPVLRLGAAGARVDGDDGVLAIVLAAEHLLGLAGLDLGGEVVEPAREVVGNRLARVGPLDQHGEVLDAPVQRGAEVAILFQAAAALEELLRPDLILPEVRVGDARFDVRQFVRGLCGVKDSSAGRWRGAPGHRACEAVRQGERPYVRESIVQESVL